MRRPCLSIPRKPRRNPSPRWPGAAARRPSCPARPAGAPLDSMISIIDPSERFHKRRLAARRLVVDDEVEVLHVPASQLVRVGRRDGGMFNAFDHTRIVTARPPLGSRRSSVAPDHPFQKFPRLRLAVARHLHPDPLMEKCIHVLDQRGDLAQDEVGNARILQQSPTSPARLPAGRCRP